MSILYVFGDSFTTPNFCVVPCDSFWGLLAKDLKVDQIINYSHSGFSLDQIIHILVNETFDNTAYFLVGIPPIERLAMYFENSTKQWPAAVFDTNFNKTIQCADTVNQTQHYDFFEVFGKEKFFITNYSYHWQQQLVCDKIFLIYNTLKNLNLKFLIINLTEPMYYHSEVPAQKKLNELSECILFDNTCHSVNQQDDIKPADWDQGTGWYGHHGAEGNLNWYTKILKPKVIELGWLAS